MTISTRADPGLFKFHLKDSEALELNKGYFKFFLIYSISPQTAKS